MHFQELCIWDYLIVIIRKKEYDVLPQIRSCREIPENNNGEKKERRGNGREEMVMKRKK